MTDAAQIKVNENGEEKTDVLREKVSEYKRTHPEELPELDYALFLKFLARVHENCPIKIARNAFNDMREWIPGTETWNVSGVYLSDDLCVTFVLSHTKDALTVEALLDELEPINKRLPHKNVPVMLQLNKETVIKATDVYAHSLVTSQWAGLPVDFVLCYKQKKKEHAHVPAQKVQTLEQQ